MRTLALLIPLLAALGLLLAGCPDDPEPVDDDDTTAAVDDDDTVDDDDSAVDDDDTTPEDDDDTFIDDDDTVDDDDSAVDDDDTVDDDDSAVVDDDDTTPDVCTDDAFENNDSLAVPAGIVVGDWPDLAACPADDDYYTLALEEGETLVVDLSFLHVDGNIDLRLIDPDGAVAALSVSNDDDESASWQAEQDGPHFIRVNLLTDTGSFLGNDYDMSVQVEAPPCPDDGYEDNDTAPSAVVMVDGEYLDLRVCDADDDWWSVSMAPDDELAVYLFFSHAEGNIDLELYDTAGTLLATSITGTDNESVSGFIASLPGDYLVRVLLTGDAGIEPGNEYDMDLQVTPWAPACVDDAFEDNDVNTAATPLTAGSWSGLGACPADEDWYAVGMAAGDTIDVDILFPALEGNVDLMLVDPAGVVVAVSNGTNDSEDVSWTAVLPGDHLVQVELVSDSGVFPGNAYGMTIGVTPAPACADDTWEDNDSQVSAPTITPGVFTPLQSCAGDDDWFGVWVEDGGILDANVLFDDDEGNIDLRIVDPGGTTVASSLSTTSDESVSYSAVTTGLHAVRVTLTAEDGLVPGNAYDLEVEVTAPCIDDGYEDNDSQLTAVTLSTGATNGLGSCPSDDDYYQVPLVVGDELNVDLVFDHAEGNIDLEVMDPSYNLVAAAYSVTDGESVGPIVASADGDHLIRVFLTADQGALLGNAYDIVVDVLPISSICFDDFSEENDTSLTATPVSSGSYPSLMTCDADDDWFAISLLTGDELTVDVFFNDAEGDIDAQLYDPSGTLVQDGNSSDDDEVLGPLAVTPGGLWLIRVFLFADAGAYAGNDYDLQLGVTPAACGDDIWENNDYDLFPAAVLPDVYPDLVTCPGDDDWFALEGVFIGDVLTGEFTFSDAEGDIDVELIDPIGTVVDLGNTSTDDETVSALAGLPGTWLFHVWLDNDDGVVLGNSYEFELDLVPVDCGDDALEDNDDEFNAVAISSGFFSSLTSCPTDEDWYVASVDVGGEILADIFFDDEQGDIDAELIDPSGAVVDSASSSDDDEQLGPWPVLTSGDHLIRVFLYDDGGDLPGNDYSLDASIMGPCIDDAFEEDDNPLSATPIVDGNYAGLSSCPFDEDWFAIDLTTGDDLLVDVFYAAAEGELDVALFDPSSTIVTAATSTSSGGQLGPYTALVDGTFGLRVQLDSDAGNNFGNSPYSMDVSVNLAVCLDDVWENNDTDASASVVTGGVYNGIDICPADEDWFAVEALIGDSLSVQLGFEHAYGDVDMELYDPDLLLLDVSTSTTDDEAVGPAPVLVPGYHLVRIWLAGEADLDPGNDYDMTVNHWIASCIDDASEDNDSDLQTAPGYDGPLPNLMSCPSDEDWFASPMLINDTLGVDLTFLHSEGDIDVEILDPSLAPRGSSTSVTDDESIAPITAAVSGDHFIRVWLVNDTGGYVGNDYDMDISLAAATCADDAFEDNDTDVTAATVSPALHSNLGICDADEDWYSIILSAGDDLTVDLTFSDGDGNIDLWVHDPTTTLLGESVSITDDESVGPEIAPIGGQYLIHVQLVADDGPTLGNSYSMNVALNSLLTCVDDAYEDNDSLATAASLVPGGYPGLAVCPGDDDFFAVTLSVGDTIQADLVFDHSEGNVDCQLLDPTGATVAMSISATDDETLGPWTAVMDGDHVINAAITADNAVPGNVYDMAVGVW